MNNPMTAQEILAEIKPLGRDSYRNVLFNHGIPEPCYGVKVEELKKIQKRIKMDYRLALDLYDTGVYDAMYLAGLIADDAKMTRKDLQHWAEKACAPLARTSVAWGVAGSPHAVEMALKWIDSPKDLIAAAGWSTLGSLVAIKPDADLDLAQLKELLQRIQKTIHSAPNTARRQMNNFVIEVGTWGGQACHAGAFVGSAGPAALCGVVGALGFSWYAMLASAGAAPVRSSGWIAPDLSDICSSSPMLISDLQVA